MIVSFKSKPLRKLFEEGDSAGIHPQWKMKLRVRMARLDAATTIAEMDVAGWNLHELTGNRKGEWSVKVTANVRLTFGFDDEENEAYDVDVEDYH